MGDFNCVRRSCEQEGVGVIEVGRREMDDFNGFINNMELGDFPLLRRKLTWYRSNEFSRRYIDRVLLSREWLVT